MNSKYSSSLVVTHNALHKKSLEIIHLLLYCKLSGLGAVLEQNGHVIASAAITSAFLSDGNPTQTKAAILKAQYSNNH